MCGGLRCRGRIRGSALCGEGAEAVQAVGAGELFELLFGERGEKEAAVRFAQNAGVEDGDHAAVVLAADESADTLTELDEGVRQGEFVERVASPGADPFATGFGNGVAWVFERQTGDDNLGEAGANRIRSAGKVFLWYGIPAFSPAIRHSAFRGGRNGEGRGGPAKKVYLFRGVVSEL